jgi:myo-inositol-1(or 4)-monophosphatase
MAAGRAHPFPFPPSLSCRYSADSMDAFSGYAAVALRAACAAARVHRAFFRRLTRVEYKGLHDPVTEADRDAEAAIIRAIREAYPDHAILGEEGGRRGRGPFTWHIDPLDGTFNYARGIPWFAASVGLEHEGRRIAGAVLNTMTGDACVAEAGAGAWTASLGEASGLPEPGTEFVGWRRLRAPATARLDEATLSTGFPNTIAETHGNIDHLIHLLVRAAKIRAMGSAALSLTAIALGQMEGFWEPDLHSWDFTAGALIVEEAGGRVSDFRGAPLDARGRHILATNGPIHEQVLAVLAQGRSGLD